MAYEKRDGDIAVFLENEKRNERAPDWKGEALLDGKKYEVALWAKGGRGTMLAGSIKPAREGDFRGGGAGVRRGGDEGLPGRDRDPAAYELDDDVPFATRNTIR